MTRYLPVLIVLGILLCGAVIFFGSLPDAGTDSPVSDGVARATPPPAESDAEAGSAGAGFTPTPIPQTAAASKAPAIRIAGKVVAPGDRPFTTGILHWSIEESRQWWEESASASGDVSLDGPAFEFGVPVPGSYRLRVEADGFAKLSYPIEVEGGRDDVELTLLPGAAISGRIAGANGQPVSKAKISAWAGRDVRADLGDGVNLTDASTESGEDGCYKLDFLLEGKPHHIKVSAATHLSATAERIIPPAENLDFVLNPAATIAGTVISATDGAPRPDIRVIAYRNWEELASTASGVDGKYLLGGLESGVVRVIAYGHGVISHRDPGEGVAVQTEAGKALEGVDLQVFEGGIIEAEIVDMAGMPIQGVRVRAYLDHQFPGTASINYRYRRQHSSVVTSNDLGAALLAGLWDGKWFVEAKHDDFVSKLAQSTAVEIVNGGAGKIRIQLERGYSIAGRVTTESGDFIEDVEIKAEAAFLNENEPNHNVDLNFNVKSDSDGNYILQPLPAGLVNLRAAKDGYAMTRIAKAEVGRQDVDITMHEGAVIAGKVMDALGRGVEGGRGRRAVADGPGLNDVRRLARAGPKEIGGRWNLPHRTPRAGNLFRQHSNG